MTDTLFAGIRWGLFSIAALVASLVLVLAKPSTTRLPPPVELQGKAARPVTDEFVVITAPTVRFDSGLPGSFDDDEGGTGLPGGEESADSVSDSEGSADSPDDED